MLLIDMSNMMKLIKISISYTMTLFIGDIVYSLALAQEFIDNYVLPVVLVYPSVWKENGVVAPTIEVKVLDQVKEASPLNAAEGDEKLALDTECSIKYFEIPKSQVNVGDLVDVCISPIDSENYANLSQCKKATIGDDFPEIAVFTIE
ncbi:MAG: hypothetical protein M3530_06565 [Thermoproteota archaeon]|nr:hypothetical protein [Thermoproteota archaeon]